MAPTSWQYPPVSLHHGPIRVSRGRTDKNDVVQSFITHYGYFALFVLSVLSSACIPIPRRSPTASPGRSAPRRSPATCASRCGPSSSWARSVHSSARSSPTRSDAAPVERSSNAGASGFCSRPRTSTAREGWFEHYGSASVLIGRVIPVVRSFISVPAGMAEMNRARFAILTTIGSAAWVALLAGLGYAAGANWKHVSGDFHASEYPIIAIVVLGLAYAIWHRWRTVRRENAASSSAWRGPCRRGRRRARRTRRVRSCRWGRSTNVERMTPVTFLPYIIFSP